MLRAKHVPVNLSKGQLDYTRLNNTSRVSNIICNDVSMGLQLGKCHIDTGSPYDVDYFLNNARVGDGGLNPPAFSSMDPDCLGPDDGDYLTFYMNSTTCGTGMNETDNWYTFYNHVTRKLLDYTRLNLLDLFKKLVILVQMLSFLGVLRLNMTLFVEFEKIWKPI